MSYGLQWRLMKLQMEAAQLTEAAVCKIASSGRMSTFLESQIIISSSYGHLSHIFVQTLKAPMAAIFMGA